ncbi:MAG: cell division protein ZapA [Treponema sp.]|jgi:cell division protein ZapA (FtsZ GTPase activity inhibitor)|nr:cell division protein ZapA [Treponema sp.]MDR1219998.1 cell division protein ZapA [Treponema sp.]
MAKTNLRIEVLGASLSIAAEEDSEYLKRLLERYQLAVEETQNSTGLKDPLRLAILTGFLAYDNYLKVCDRHEAEQEISIQEEQETEKITRHLLECMDEILENGI